MGAKNSGMVAIHLLKSKRPAKDEGNDIIKADYSINSLSEVLDFIPPIR
jgi:FMN phosphatase YigB (HAD superfamily)